MKKFFASFMFLFFSFILFAQNWTAENPGPVPEMPKDRPSVCLVLAGGGAKGFSELPIIELIEELDIPIDMVIGTSIGSIIGGLYCAGYTPREILDEFDKVEWTPLFSDLTATPYESILGEHSIYRAPLVVTFDQNFSLNLGNSISKGQNIYALLKQLTLKYPSDASFDDFVIPFRSMVVDIVSGEGVVLNSGDLSEAIRASMSLPAVFEPMEIDGHYYMDGGLRNNLAINVARNMGYDVVIAIDISAQLNENIDSYNSNPAVAIMNVSTIANFERNKSLYKDADIVMEPDMSNFGLLDFKKSSLIYEQGEISAEYYRDQLEDVRKLVYPDDYDEEGKRISAYKELKKRGDYRRKPNYIPTEIRVKGAFKQDEKYIQNSFKKLDNHELQPESFSEFMRTIYLTGNYENVKTRVFEEGDETILELNLSPKDTKNFKLLINTDLKQTLSKVMDTGFTMGLDFQARGFTGMGSIFGLSTKFLNDYGLSGYYFQPFNPYIYTSLSSEFIDKKFNTNTYTKKITEYEDSSDLFKSNDYITYENRKFFNKAEVGLRTNNGNLVKIGGFYDYNSVDWLTFLKEPYIQQEDTSVDIERYQTDSYRIYGLCFGPYLQYTLDKLDRPNFPRKGIYLDSTTKVIFPILGNRIETENMCVISNLDFTGAIPMGKKFSLTFNLFGGSDFTQRLTTSLNIMPLEGFSTYNRVYFPQIAAENCHGQNMAAASLTLQFQPVEYLTILGGSFVIRLSGTFGNVTNDWKDFFNTMDYMHFDAAYTYPMLWSGSIGVGIIAKQNYTVLLRIGAGSTDQSAAEPFLTLDIGSYRY